MNNLVMRSSAEWKREVFVLREENERLRHALEVIVRGATATMGQDSSGWDYAYVRQAMLDVGREVLADEDALKADVTRNLDRTRALGRERGWPTA